MPALPPAGKPVFPALPDAALTPVPRFDNRLVSLSANMIILLNILKYVGAHFPFRRAILIPVTVDPVGDDNLVRYRSRHEIALFIASAGIGLWRHHEKTCNSA